MGVKPPPSWRSSGGGDGRHVVPPRGGTSKRVSLGPTDTGSLQELLEVAGTEAPAEVSNNPFVAGIAFRCSVLYIAQGN